MFRRLCILATVLLGACAQRHDPTAIQPPVPTAVATPLPTPTPLPSGVQFNLLRASDPFAPSVQHAWVQDGLGNDLLTLETTNGFASYDCPPANFCPCESTHWPAYCGANAADLTDANSHATIFYSANTPLAFNWDWRDRGGSLVPNGTYFLKAEVSNYNGSYSLATVSVARDGASGSATGTVSGLFLSASATWNP